MRTREKKKVLFLCTGNSARSQMAEAIVNDRLGDSWQASSAGSRPAGYVHPKAVQVLNEIGIAHAGRSKSMEEFRRQDFDLVVTVCDDSAEECPVWLPVPRPGGAGGKGRQIHHAFPDPAATDRLEDFRQVRDGIIAEILPMLEEHGEG